MEAFICYMPYFHDMLLHAGFRLVREGFYTRLGPAVGGPLYASTGPADEASRKLMLWQAQRVLLQGDIVTLQALEQVLNRVIRLPEQAQRGHNASRTLGKGRK